MVCKNRGVYGFFGPSWVESTYITCPPVLVERSPDTARSRRIEAALLERYRAAVETGCAPTPPRPSPATSHQPSSSTMSILLTENTQQPKAHSYPTDARRLTLKPRTHFTLNMRAAYRHRPCHEAVHHSLQLRYLLSTPLFCPWAKAGHNIDTGTDITRKSEIPLEPW